MSSIASARVVVLGGGLAGLTAALELADHGLPVTLLEQAAVVGGRARSWRDPDGDRVGNLSHLVAGWHLNVRGQLSRLNRLDRLQDHPASAVSGPGRRLSRLSTLSLPGPLARLARLSLYPEFSAQEKSSTYGIALLLASYQGDRLDLLDEISLRAWGIGFNASIHPFLRHLLEPYALHTLTTTGHDISARTASAAVRQQMEGPRPFISSFRASLQEDLVEPMLEMLRQKGVEVLTGTPVSGLIAGRTRLEAVMSGDRRFEASHFVSALPPERLVALLSPELLRYHYFRDLARLRTLPWASLQLFFRVKLLDFKEPIIYPDSELGLSCRDITDSEPPPRHAGTVLTCDLTRYESFAGLPDEAILKQALRELQVLFPQLRPEWLEKFVLHRNDDAPNFLPLTGSWRLRPRVRSPFSNLLLAGDWIRHPVDLACLEGAVVSGKLAAHAVLEDHDIPHGEVLEVAHRGTLRAVSRTADLVEWPRRLVRRAVARIDRRRHARVEGALEGYIEDVETHLGWSPVLVLSMSPGGVFFVSEASPRVGARIRLRIRTHCGEQLELRAKVVRVEEVPDWHGGGIGVGCKVRPYDEPSELLWERLTHPD